MSNTEVPQLLCDMAATMSLKSKSLQKLNEIFHVVALPRHKFVTGATLLQLAKDT
jgi:hypothetical protein